MQDKFGLLTDNKTFMIINQSYIKCVILSIEWNWYFLGIFILNSNNSKILTLLAKRHKKLSILDLLEPAFDPKPNLTNRITILIIKLKQFAINMILLKTNNRTFSDNSPWSNSTWFQLNNVKTMSFRDFREQNLLVYCVEGSFKTCYLDCLFDCWVDVK